VIRNHVGRPKCSARAAWIVASRNSRPRARRGGCRDEQRYNRREASRGGENRAPSHAPSPRDVKASSRRTESSSPTRSPGGRTSRMQRLPGQNPHVVAGRREGGVGIGGAWRRARTNRTNPRVRAVTIYVEEERGREGGRDSHVWRHSEMVVASRRRRRQSGHVMQRASRSRLTMTSPPLGPAGAGAGAGEEEGPGAPAPRRRLFLPLPAAATLLPFSSCRSSSSPAAAAAAGTGSSSGAASSAWASGAATSGSGGGAGAGDGALSGEVGPGCMAHAVGSRRGGVGGEGGRSGGGIEVRTRRRGRGGMRCVRACVLRATKAGRQAKGKVGRAGKPSSGGSGGEEEVVSRCEPGRRTWPGLEAVVVYFRLSLSPVSTDCHPSDQHQRTLISAQVARSQVLVLLHLGNKSINAIHAS
jgi:hypothetical protein